MKKALLFTILIFLVFIGYSQAACTGSSPVWNATPDLASVQTCVTNASRGDTVYVSSGSATWTSSLSITKAITLKGAGVGGTTITGNITPTVDSYFGVLTSWLIRFSSSSPSSDSNTLLRITGFTFNGDSKNNAIYVYNSSSTSDLNKVMIDNNYFTNCRTYKDSTHSPSIDKTIMFHGNIYGVVHSNSFFGWVGLFTTGYSYGDSLGGRTSFLNEPFSRGSDNHMYWEDNTITYTGTAQEQIFGGSWGGSYVMRWNTININSAISKYAVDYHGNQPSLYGVRGGENYGNLYTTVSNFIRIADMAGGSHYCFYNRINSAASGDIQVRETYKDHVTGYPCVAGTLYSGNYCSVSGQPQHIWDTYVWNNRAGLGDGSILVTNNSTGSEPAPWTPTALRRNTDFWRDYGASCVSGGACSSGVGCGTTLPTSCTAGTGFWIPNSTIDPTAASCSNFNTYVGANNAIAQSVGGNIGTFYKCTSLNNWTNTYHPATYPHYLRTQTQESSPPVLSGTASPTGSQACPANPTDIPVSFTVTDQNTVTCYSCENGVGGCSSSSTYDQIAAMAGKTTYTSTQSGTSHAQTATISSACDTASIQHWARCADSLGNKMTTSIGISYSTESGEDSDVPTLTAAAIDTTGTKLTLTFSEPVRIGAGGSGGWTLSRTRSGTPAEVALTYDSLTGNTIVYSLASVILSTDTAITLDYAQPGDGITDLGGTPIYCSTSPDASRMANLLCEAPDGTSDGLAGWTIQRSKRYPTADPDAGNVVSFANACDETASLGCADIGTTNCMRTTKAQCERDEDVYAFKKLTDTDLTGDIYLQFYFKNMGQPKDVDCDWEDEGETSWLCEACASGTNMTDGHDVEIIGFTPGQKTTYAALPGDYPANVYMGLQQRDGKLTVSAFHYVSHNHEIRGTTDVGNDGSKWIGVRLHIYNSATAGADYYEWWADWAGDGTWTYIGASNASPGYYDHSTSSYSTAAITFAHPFRYIYIGQNDLEGNVDFQVTGIKVNTTGFPSDCTRTSTSYNEFVSIGDPESVTNNSSVSSTTTQSFFDHTATVTPQYVWTASDFNAGLKFQSSATGTITNICFYKDASMTGTHTGHIFQGSEMLAQITFSGETASGWQCQAFSGVNILKDTIYTVSVYSPTNWIQTQNFFTNGLTAGNLTASSDNGYWIFSNGAADLPTNPSGSKSNYWVDIVMDFSGATGPWEATVTNSSAAGAKCSITEPASTKMSIANGATGEAVVVVSPGWKATISGCGGSTVTSGNTYTFTTAAMSADCEITVTCSEKQVVPWIAE